ncbi:2-hydroxy-6-oxonona-2,4-dienedioate hydrolase [Rhodococcus sp. BE178]
MTIDVSYEGTKRELVTDEGVLRYHVAGAEDAPPLLLLHGSGPGVSGWRNYRGNLGVFAEHYRCYILEFPGFGVSDPTEGHPVLAAGSAVTGFMDALGIASAAMVGNSMGGIVAVNLAIHAPARVSRLITIGGVGPHVLSPDPSEGRRLLHDFVADPSKENLARWLRAMVYDTDVVTEQLIEERWEAARDPDSLEAARVMYGAESFALQQQSLLRSGRPPYWAMMHKVSCPTMLTWGLDDRMSPPDMGMASMRLIPDAELRVFPKCGHWVMIEAKTAFERSVLEFLQR